MAKKLFVMLLAVVVLTSACGDSGQQIAESTEATTAQVSETTTQTSETAAPTSESVTTQPTSSEAETTTVELADVDVAEPLSYEQVINKDMYIGFSDAQLAMLNGNGFVVLKPQSEYPNIFMHHQYEGAEYGDESVFITTDAVLNMFHMYYSGSMKALETIYYYNDIVALTNGLCASAERAYNQSDEQLKAHYKRLYAYLVVAGKLLHSEDFDLAEDLQYAPQKLVEVKREMLDNRAEWLNLYSRVPDEVAQLADADYAVVTSFDSKVSVDNDGIVASQILDKRIDATQYLVRGHYTQSKLLSNYFRGMMWYSQSGFDIDIEKRDNVVVSQLLAQLIASDSKVSQMWNDVYQLTAFYSGESDDLNYKDIVQLTESVYGADYNPLVLIDDSYDEALKMAIDALPKPKIVPVLNEKGDYQDMDYKRQYRLMGQRFTFDSYAMTKLTKSPERLNISAFDVLAMTGNQKAEEILNRVYKPAEYWQQYPQALESVKGEYAEYKNTPIKDIYKGWFKAIDLALNESFDGEIPYFMSTDAYAYKRVNTALGSFAELKHDNVLYAKQMMAEFGGGDDEAGLPLHYVEPNVKMYQTLREIIALAKGHSDAYQDKMISGPLDDMMSYLNLFIAVSHKELTGGIVTQDELREIAYFGGMVDNLRVSYNYYIRDLLNGEYEAEKTSALISDIATILQLGYLELGIGLPHDIYALVEVNGHPVITKGVVYSAYSFYNEERLTDEKWQAMLGLIKGEYEFMDYDESKRSIDLLTMMPYTKKFISEEDNKIEPQYIEMAWPKE